MLQYTDESRYRRFVFLSCRLWIPEILQSQWFWTLYEKSDWIHSPQTALTVLLSYSCGSTSCCFHSYPLFPQTFFLVSQLRDWIAAPTSKCKSSLPQPQTKSRPNNICHEPNGLICGPVCRFWASSSQTWHFRGRCWFTQGLLGFSWPGVTPQVCVFMCLYVCISICICR